MTTYCRNGHPITGPIVRDRAYRGPECPVCGAAMSEYLQPDPAPRWALVLLVFVALTVAGAWWWWLWLAPR